MSGASVALIRPSTGMHAVNDNNPDPLLRMAEILGRLEGTVTAIQNDVTEIKNNARDDRDASTEGRRRLHEKFESVSHGLEATKSGLNILGKIVDKQTKDIEALTNETATLKPVVMNTAQEVTALKPIVIRTAQTLTRWTVRFGAIIGGLTLIGTGAWYLITTYGGAILRFLGQFIEKG